MGLRASTSRLAPILLFAWSACSAIVNPDTDELGGADLAGDDNGGANAGSTGGDAGGGGGNNCPQGCPADQRCSPVLGCIPILCRANIDCSDGDLCTGIEACTPGMPGADSATGCAPGIAKNCDDGITCTVDSCDPQTDCAHTPNNTFCDDGIGCTNDVCDAAAIPGSDGCTRTPDDSKCSFCYSDGVCSVEERGCTGLVPTNCSDGDACTTDVCLDDAQMCAHTPRDEDGDGAVLDTCGGTDCDDTDPSVKPGATEICDGQDDNCDRQVDEICSSLPEDCETKQTVNLINGHADISGALSDFDSDYGTVCGQSGGSDAVYVIPITTTSDIVIDSNGSAARVVLAVTDDCTDNQFELGCAGPIANGQKRTRLMLHRYTPPPGGGGLILLVDGLTAGETGAFTVSIDVTPAVSDSCGAGFELGACGTVIGTVSDVLGQQRGSCQSGGDQARPEGVFTVQGPDDGTLEVSVTSSNFAPALYARNVCNSNDRDDELGCDVPDNGGPIGGQSGRAQLSLESKPGTDLTLFVDGAFAGNRYTLRCVP